MNEQYGKYIIIGKVQLMPASVCVQMKLFQSLPGTCVYAKK